MELAVTETEPGVQGDRVSGARKPATLETGLLVQVLTAPIAILIDAFSFVVSAVCLGGIRRPEPPVRPTTDGHTTWMAIREGLRLVVHDPILRAIAGARATIEQAAASLDISIRTTNRHWAYAKAWLYQQLSEHRPDAGEPARG